MSRIKHKKVRPKRASTRRPLTNEAQRIQRERAYWAVWRENRKASEAF